MCFLRPLILLLIVSLQHLMAKAESQLFIFPLTSNLQSHPELVTCRFPDENKLHLRRLHESAGCVFPWQTCLSCWLLMCFAWQQMSCSDLGKSRQPLLVPTGFRWTGDSFEISMLTEIVKPGCFCFTLQLLHQCCQLYPGGVPLESACARFVTWWGKPCCANQVSTKIQTEMLWVYFGLKRHISSCVLLHFGGQQA